MSDQAFADAARQAPRRILRVPLLEYSIGHEILLTRERNSLLASEQDFNLLPPEAQRFSILRSVQICSRTWAQNKKPDRWVKLWGRIIRGENFPLAIAEFRIYRSEGSTFPRINEQKEGDARNLGAPFMARLLDYSCRAFGDEGFDKPLGLIQWLYFAQAEYDGGCQIENALERQIREEEEQIKADYAKEQEAKKCRP